MKIFVDLLGMVYLKKNTKTKKTQQNPIILVIMNMVVWGKHQIWTESAPLIGPFTGQERVMKCCLVTLSLTMVGIYNPIVALLVYLHPSNCQSHFKLIPVSPLDLEPTLRIPCMKSESTLVFGNMLTTYFILIPM